MDEGRVRRQQDRRQGERRGAPRFGADRRRGDRRRAGALSAGALAAAMVMSSGSDADAQIYTRKNAQGTVEATNVPDGSDYRLTYAGKGTLIHSRAWRLRPSYNGEYNHHIAAAAGTHGVSIDLVRAVIQVESDFDHLATSSAGAQGLMQLMPSTARRFGVSNSFDPRQNIFAGVQYLRFLLDMFHGDVALATAAYNAGENAVVRYNGIPPYKETRNYVSKIQTLLAGGGPLLAAAAPAALQAAMFIVPNDPHFKAPSAAATRKPAAPARVTPARPRVFYKWKDASGVMHVGQSTPPEGVVYSMIRALD